MDLLFRLSQDIEGFEDIKETKYFFENTLKERDENYFYNTKKFSLKKINNNDSVYFSYDGYIVAEAIFCGDIIDNSQRSSEYRYGHKLRNIKIVNSNLKIDFAKFKVLFSMKYIDSTEWYEEIQRVINGSNIDITLSEELSEEELNNLEEGERTQIVVNHYERNLQARQKCLDKYGYNCSVCEFNFKDVYGEIGKDFIHVHHLVDISTIGKNYTVDPINDLKPVCPNCHAMLHKQKPAYSIDKLKKIMNI
jgi:hypothetical protein